MTPPWEGVLGECGLSFFAVGGLYVWVSNDSPAVPVLVAIDCRGLAGGRRAGGDDLMMEHGGRRAQGVFVMAVQGHSRAEYAMWSEGSQPAPRKRS